MTRSIALWSSPKMREQDVAAFVSRVIRNSGSRDEAWEALEDRWPEMHEKLISFGGGGAVAALGVYCDPEARDESATFFASPPAPGAERALKRSLESIDHRVELKALRSESPEYWLAGR